MKSCQYCGHTNTEATESCRECGTPLADKVEPGVLFRSSPPGIPLLLGLSIAAVEAPLLIAFLLARSGPHDGPEWRYWPLLTGLFPVFLTTQIQLVPRNVPIIGFRAVEALFTAGFITLVVYLASRTVFWRQILMAAFAVSGALAILAFLLLAA